MTDTTDFELWIEENEPMDYEKIYWLYRATLDRKTHLMVEVTTKDAKTFIKGHEGWLQLLSEDARLAFLSRIEELSEKEPDDTMESWYEVKRAMEKED